MMIIDMKDSRHHLKQKIEKHVEHLRNGKRVKKDGKWVSVGTMSENELKEVNKEIEDYSVKINDLESKRNNFEKIQENTGEIYRQNYRFISDKKQIAGLIKNNLSLNKVRDKFDKKDKKNEEKFCEILFDN